MKVRFSEIEENQDDDITEANESIQETTQPIEKDTQPTKLINPENSKKQEETDSIKLNAELIKEKTQDISDSESEISDLDEFDDLLEFDDSELPEEEQLKLDPINLQTNIEIITKEIVKDKWEVIYQEETIIEDLINQFIEEKLTDTNRKHLSTKELYQIRDRVQQIIHFIKKIIYIRLKNNLLPSPTIQDLCLNYHHEQSFGVTDEYTLKPL